MLTRSLLLDDLRPSGDEAEARQPQAWRAPVTLVARAAAVTAEGGVVLIDPRDLSTIIADSMAQGGEPARAGDEVVALFSHDRPPVILGVVRPAVRPGAQQVLRVDGQRLAVAGHEEVELSCGRASIRLQADGKIVISGDYVISRATTTNAIEGAVIKVN